MSSSKLHSDDARTDVSTDGDTKPDVVLVCKAIGDPLRANILRAMAHDSFAVLELGEIFAMAQPAISHHLKMLHEAGLVSKRREGTSIFYQREVFSQQPDSQRAYIAALFRQLDTEPLTLPYRSNVELIYQQRLQRSMDFFNSNADALRQQTELICAPSVYAQAVIQGALQKGSAAQRALEVGPGDGTVLAELSEHFAQVVGIDMAGEMLSNARSRVGELSNVQLLEEDFLTLRGESRFDLVVASMVLHHSASPLKFLRKAAKLLRAEGLLVIAELCAHDQDWVKTACGDVWLGFDHSQLQDWAQRAGCTSVQQQFLAQRNGFRVQVHTYQLK